MFNILLIQLLMLLLQSIVALIINFTRMLHANRASSSYSSGHLLRFEGHLITFYVYSQTFIGIFLGVYFHKLLQKRCWISQDSRKKNQNSNTSVLILLNDIAKDYFQYDKKQQKKSYSCKQERCLLVKLTSSYLPKHFLPKF